MQKYNYNLDFLKCHFNAQTWLTWLLFAWPCGLQAVYSTDQEKQVLGVAGHKIKKTV